MQSKTKLLYYLVTYWSKFDYLYSILYKIRLFLLYGIENMYIVTVHVGCWGNEIAGTALKIIVLTYLEKLIMKEK